MQIGGGIPQRELFHLIFARRRTRAWHDKGDRLTFQMARVNDEVWLPKSILIAGSARVMLVKGYRGDIAVSYSNYKKFSADSRVVSVGQ